MFKEEYDTLIVKKIRGTDKAILVEYEHEQAWIPLSLFGIGSGSEIEGAAPGEEVKVHIPRWKMNKLGW